MGESRCLPEGRPAKHLGNIAEEICGGSDQLENVSFQDCSGRCPRGFSRRNKKSNTRITAGQDSALIVQETIKPGNIPITVYRRHLLGNLIRQHVGNRITG